jgi:hypothetical protein
VTEKTTTRVALTHNSEATRYERSATSLHVQRSIWIYEIDKLETTEDKKYTAFGPILIVLVVLVVPMKRIFRGGGSSGKGRGQKDSHKHPSPPPSQHRQQAQQHPQRLSHPEKASSRERYNDNKSNRQDIIMTDVEGDDGMVMVGEERDITLPLSGARVMIVTEDSETRREMTAFITALGGSMSHHAQHATHALWATASSPAADTTSTTAANSTSTSTTHDDVVLDLAISDNLRRTLWECQRQNVPVVSSSWLERMSGLREGEHWSEINVDPYVPPILAMMGDDDDDDDDDDENHDIGMEDNRIHHDEDDFLFVQTVTGTLDDDETTQEESVDYTLETVVVESISPNGEEVEVVPLTTTTTTTTTASPSYASSSRRRSGRRDPASRLSRSIAQTFSILTQESPDQMEEEAIRRAMELSLLDCALVFRKSSSYSTTASYRTSYSTGSNSNNKTEWKPHDILGVTEAATPKQIKSAYRKLALKNHPDKGGSADQFEKIARAYRSLLSMDSCDSSTYSSRNSTMNNNHQLKGTAHWDSELQDHRRLVHDLFQAHGSDIDTFVAKQVQVLQELNLTHKDAGATNVNENDELIHNSCFYLSLAASYLGGIGALVAEDYIGDNNSDIDDNEEDSADRALIGETALQLKRIIEAAVVKAHPEWAAQGMVGEEVQAFSDFLVYTLDSSTLLSDWAVVVFDTTSGFCDVYKGQHYMETSSGAEMATAEEEEWGRSNTLTLRYIPGHYQPLVRGNKSVPRPALKRVLEACDRAGVFYVVTDGAA